MPVKLTVATAPGRFSVQPAVVVDLPRSAYEKTDPTWNKAIEVLRAKVAAAKK
jgi:hypothetical protein